MPRPASLFALLLFASLVACAGTSSDVERPPDLAESERSATDDPNAQTITPVPVTAARPMLRDGYAAEFTPDGDVLFAEKYFDFVGDLLRVRVRYVYPPEGDIKVSTFKTCEAELELPIVWHEGGFRVVQTLNTHAERGDFERIEAKPNESGARQADTNKHLISCWLTVLEGDYAIDELSTNTYKGRPKTARLTEPDGKVRMLDAVPPVSESDLIDTVNDHFWK